MAVRAKYTASHRRITAKVLPLLCCLLEVPLPFGCVWQT